MTQQFKFGDRVRWADDPRQFFYLYQDDANPEAGWIHSDDGSRYLAAHSTLQANPPPRHRAAGLAGKKRLQSNRKIVR